MFTRKMSTRLLVAVTIIAQPLSVANANIVVAFFNPTANQAYGIGASITYNGTATWVVGTDTAPVTVQVELR
jgi:hypothetical protein